MIEDLLNHKNITPEQYETYMLFQANELGRKMLSRMTMAYFMDEPTRDEFGNAGFAFYDGRRSVFRDIHRSLKFVERQLMEMQNDLGINTTE